jgi:hypothetical protein
MVQRKRRRVPIPAIKLPDNVEQIPGGEWAAAWQTIDPTEPAVRVVAFADNTATLLVVIPANVPEAVALSSAISAHKNVLEMLSHADHDCPEFEAAVERLKVIAGVAGMMGNGSGTTMMGFLDAIMQGLSMASEMGDTE